MKDIKSLSILISGLFLLFAACISQPRNRSDYYTLEYDPPRIGDLEPLPLVIRMVRFSVAPNYNTNRIIYRDRSFKRNSYVIHKWRANPGDLVSYFLNRDFKESGLFKAFLPHDSRLPSSYIMEGMVEDFFERDLENRWEAVLTVSITLMAEKEPDISKSILFQKSYLAVEGCRQNNPRSLAEAMSKAMAEVSEEIIKDTYHCLKDR